jgi:hypothetical protein
MQWMTALAPQEARIHAAWAGVFSTRALSSGVSEKRLEEEGNLAAQIVELRPRLVRFAWSLSHDSEVAEDLAQETIARALASRWRYQPGTSRHRIDPNLAQVWTSYLAAISRLIQNRVRPGRESTPTLPPAASTSCLTTARPIPAPPWAVSRDLSTR